MKEKIFLLFFVSLLISKADQAVSFSETERIFEVAFPKDSKFSNVRHIEMNLSNNNGTFHLYFGAQESYAYFTRIDNDQLCELIKYGINKIKNDCKDIKLTVISFDLYISSDLWEDYRNWIKIESKKFNGGINPKSKELYCSNLEFVKKNQTIKRISDLIKENCNAKSLSAIPGEVFICQHFGEDWAKLQEDKRLYMKALRCSFHIQY